MPLRIVTDTSVDFNALNQDFVRTVILSWQGGGWEIVVGTIWTARRFDAAGDGDMIDKRHNQKVQKCGKERERGIITFEHVKFAMAVLRRSRMNRQLTHHDRGCAIISRNEGKRIEFDERGAG